MTVDTKANLLTRANQVRTETAGFANTASRLGGLFRDIIDSAYAPPAPALVATSNIALSGVVVVDGVSSDSVTGDILATAQSSPVDNGPWTPNSSGAWSRPGYYNSDAGVTAALGQAGRAVVSGTLGAGTVWFQSSGTTIDGAKTWTRLNTASLLQDAVGVTLPAQTLTQQKGAALLRDPSNGRNVVDLGRADPREYGALAVTTETTGTCVAGGSATITLAAENGHEDGSWLFMHGAGPAHGMSTPAAPTAVVQGVTGSTQWEFQVVAMTRSYGYTAASAVTNVTNANATLSETNHIELFFTDVPGAMWYLVYARTGGAGAYSFKGAAIAHPSPYYEDCVASFRFKSAATRGLPSGIPTTPPVAARVNGLRTQVISGGGTTSLTVSPKPYTAATGTVVEHCAVIPIEDAIDATAGGVFGSRYGGQVVMAPGTYPITADLRLKRSVTLRGAHKGKSASSVVLRPKHGVQYGIDGGTMAPPRQPGELVRVGDRRQASAHGLNYSNFGTVFYCTAVTSADGTWGVTGTGGDPAWNYTDGASTTDGEVTWKANGNAGTYYTDARDSTVEGISIEFTGSAGIPGGRCVMPRDLRTYIEGFASPGGATGGLFWAPGILVSVGQYILPTNPNANGKMFRCSVAGTTDVTEPTWTRVHGSTVTDGGVTWVCEDKPMVQGATVLASTPHSKQMGVRGGCGTCFLDNGDIYHGYGCDDSTTDVDAFGAHEGHGQFVYGSDAQQSTYRVKTSGCTGYLGYCDNSFYGNAARILVGDTASKIQNTPDPTRNVQTSAWLRQSYSEGGIVDWNYPGRVLGGSGLAQNYVGSAAFDGLGPYDGKRAFDTGLAPSVAEHFYIGGVAGNGGIGFRSTGGTPAATTYYESGTDWLASTRRIRHGLTQGASPTAEDAVYSARGRMRVFPLGLRVGAGGFFDRECLIQPVITVPTVGAFRPGDWMPWGQDARRLGIVAMRFGAEGKAARANSTAYTLGQVRLSTGNKVFVCVAAGTSAASEPAGLNAALQDEFVQDGTVWWQMVLTSTYNQTARLRAVPNWSAAFITLTNADQTIDGRVSPCFECAAATANRTITLGNTFAMPGDGIAVRIPSANISGFSWTFVNGGTGGGNAAVVPANTAAICYFVMNDAGAWELEQSSLLGVPNAEQSGTATLVAGVSAAISANITSSSVIVVTLKTPNTDASTVKYAALGTDRVTGTPGSFKISALTSAGGGAINVSDVSTLDWRVVK